MAETIKKKRKNEPDGFDRFNRVSNSANVLLNIMFILMALVCIIPVLLVVAISLSAEASITDYGYHLIPKIVSFEGYSYLATQSTLIIRALGVSLFVTIVGTVLGLSLIHIWIRWRVWRISRRDLWRTAGSSARRWILHFWTGSWRAIMRGQVMITRKIIISVVPSIVWILKNGGFIPGHWLGNGRLRRMQQQLGRRLDCY